MTDNIIVTPVVTNVEIIADETVLSVASPGPQGATGPQGLVPIFSRQNLINPVVGNTRFYFDSTRIISQIRASVGTPSTGSPIVVDTLINGVSMGTVSIPANSNTATLATNRTVNLNDYATVSILSVGSTYAGSDLTLVLTIN
jgi:hypothetical protein